MTLPVTTTKQPRPPRVLVYGPGGIGKSTLAAAMPGVLVLPVEEGIDTMAVARLPQPKSWVEALQLLQAVQAEPSGYAALAIDSITALERLCQEHVAAENRVKTVAEIPYGKGFAAVSAEWSRFLDGITAIRAAGLAIVLVGHQDIVKYEDPRSAGYDRMQPRLHKSIMAQTFEFCDIVLCAAYKVYTSTEEQGFNRERTRAVGGGERMLYATEKPTHLAKNRYGIPDELPMSWAPIFDHIQKAFA